MAVVGGPIVMRLVRSEIGDVAIRRAWHKPDAIPSEVVRVHKESIRVKNWGQALLAMVCLLSVQSCLYRAALFVNYLLCVAESSTEPFWRSSKVPHEVQHVILR